MVQQLLKGHYGKLLNQGQKSGTGPEYISDFHRDVETFSVETEYKFFLDTGDSLWTSVVETPCTGNFVTHF